MLSYKSMRRKLRAARALLWRDWWNLIQAWILLLAADLSLRALPFRQILRYAALGRRTRKSLPASEATAMIQRLRLLVDTAGRNHLYPVGCLRRSLVLQWFLGRHGILTDLRIGVQKEADEPNAHAWLEYHGRPIGEPESIATRYVPFAIPETGE